ncbi:hypothetical protein DEU56DRAFT_789076 [Suillus clintonianus]|uniref:uncharacterized protein n=1 Tax=Suillus clintonianus TaxID=1904413 RepID=UPI001B85F842|nr:uncharacterized protein DEU56DRAFT_789076 [Suillus clintonianus]KAG2145153.1 hypothetical protein DEU56DRAFT_789076 [Suillus clintonianus]
MAACYSTETTDPRPLGEEDPLPEALRDIPHPMRMLCFFAVGRPDFKDHWKSMQSDQAFETVRTRLCSILANTITAAAVLIATSGVFVTTGSPVTYFDYSSPAPYFLLFISLMLAMIAMLTSGLSMIRWLHTDRQWTQEQLKPGGYFVISHLLSIVTPMFFVAWSLNCFIFGELIRNWYSLGPDAFHPPAILIAGFCSQSIIFRTVTALSLVTYVANIGMVFMEFMWKYTKSVKSG